MNVSRMMCALQIPLRHEQLLTEKGAADKDYKEAVGKLRYAINLHRSKTGEGSTGDAQLSNYKCAGSQSGVAHNVAQDNAQKHGGMSEPDRPLLET
jgi:hypothetical protein